MSSLGITQLPAELAAASPSPLAESAQRPLSPDALATPHDAPSLAGDDIAASPPLPASAIVLDILDDIAAAAATLADLAATADRTAFQDFAWMAAWQRHIGEKRKAAPKIVVGRAPDGSVLFALPLAVDPQGAVPRLTWLASDLCDYNAPLLHPQFARRFAAEEFPALWQRILAALARSGHPFDCIDLAKMPEQVAGQANPLLALPTSPNPSGAYLTHLCADWESLYAQKRSAATRKKERKQLKSLAALGEVRFVVVEDTAERMRAIELLFEQKSRALARMGAKDIFAAPAHRAFYADVVGSAATRHLVHVSRLDVGAQAVAVNVGLMHGGRYYLILSSYGEGEAAKFGPGRALLHELLQYAIAHRFAVFDFTIGDEPYKLDWSDERLVLHDHLAAVTLRGQAAVAVGTYLRRLKRAIKQTPLVWRQFTRMRAFAASVFSRRPR